MNRVMYILLIYYLYIQKLSESFAKQWEQLNRQNADAIQCNADALHHIRRGEFAAALRLWSDQCKSCLQHPPSLFNLAICYEHGIGVDCDAHKVFLLLNGVLHPLESTITALRNSRFAGS